MELFNSPLEHLLLDLIKNEGKFLGKRVPLDLHLLSTEADYGFDFFVVDIFRPNFQPDGDSLKLPMIVFPSRVVVISGVNLNSHISFLESLIKFVCGFIDFFFFSFVGDGDNDNLNVCHEGRKD
jgi:hypothetical protein